MNKHYVLFKPKVCCKGQGTPGKHERAGQEHLLCCHLSHLNPSCYKVALFSSLTRLRIQSQSLVVDIVFICRTVKSEKGLTFGLLLSFSILSGGWYENNKFIMFSWRKSHVLRINVGTTKKKITKKSTEFIEWFGLVSSAGVVMTTYPWEYH